jgi:hypothetical protein
MVLVNEDIVYGSKRIFSTSGVITC